MSKLERERKENVSILVEFRDCLGLAAIQFHGHPMRERGTESISDICRRAILFVRS